MSKNTKIVIGVVIILLVCGIAAVFFIFGVAGMVLISSSTASPAEYFLTVSEVIDRSDSLVDKSIRISGAVLGDSLQYNPSTFELSFTIADVPGDFAVIEQQGGLAKVLEDAVNDPSRPKIQISYVGPMPDLLCNQAQAILTGHLGKDGIFYAEELLLKCPPRYEEAVPEQSVN